MTVQGLGDGGAHCAIVCDASMTTYMLTHWVRDRTRGPRLPLEYAVQRLTARPRRRSTASATGACWHRACAPTSNVIDFDRLGLALPRAGDGPPGEAGRLVQRADGYVATLVAGETVVDDGELTDARPGVLVRGSRSSDLGPAQDDAVRSRARPAKSPRSRHSASRSRKPK